MVPDARIIAVTIVSALLPLDGCAMSLSRQYSHRVMAPYRRYIATPATFSLPSVDVTE